MSVDGSASHRPQAPGTTAVMVGLAAIGLAVHGWFAAGADALDSDRALVLLMARHFARGDLSLYFWQQNYMASLEPLLLTPLALVGLATPVAAAFVGIGLTAALAAITVVIARRLGGVPWVTLLLWAIPPAVVVHHHVALYGARLAATLLAVAAFGLALRARRTRSWIIVGALTGVAYFGDHLMVTWAAATLYVAAKRDGVKGVAIGVGPIVLFDTVAAMLTPAFHLSGPNAPVAWLSNVPLLFGTVIPQLFGILLSRGPAPLFEPVTSIVPSDPRWLVFAVPGAITLGVVVATLVRRRHTIFGAPAMAAGAGAVALLLACLVGVAIFLLTGGGGDRWPARYLVPLWPAVSVLAALAVAEWPRRRRMGGALLVAPAIFTLFADHAWPRGDDGTAVRAEAADIQTVVQQSGVHAVWTDYWDTYRMALRIGESPRWVALRIIERQPEWAKVAEAARPVGYLLREGDLEMTQRLLDANAHGVIHLIADQALGGYRFLVADRSAPGLIIMNGAPPRAKQMTAALGSGLLFLGIFVGVWWLARRGRTLGEPSVISSAQLQ